VSSPTTQVPVNARKRSIVQTSLYLRSFGWRTWGLFAIAAFFSAGLIWAGISAHRDPTGSAVGFLPPSPPIWPLDPPAGASAPGTERRVFPYSVIAGGANSPQELREAVTKDPVVAQHYSDFDINSARRVTLDAPQQMYVSYRLGNKVFWTKHRLTLHKGETVLTDGRSMARTRCGNRVSVMPIRPNAPLEPSVEDFEAPAVPPSTSTPYLAAYSAPPQPPTSGFTPETAGLPPSTFFPIPFFPFPGGGGVTVHGGPTPPGGGGGTPPGGGGGTPPGGGGTTPPGGGGTTPPSGGGGTPPGGGGTTPPGGGGTTPPGGGGGTPPGGGGGTPPGGGGGTPPGGGGGTPPVGVPEPATATLLLLGLASSWMLRHKRKAC
jgi:hypothetical protein